jgi:hypothetical protein
MHSNPAWSGTWITQFIGMTWSMDAKSIGMTGSLPSQDKKHVPGMVGYLDSQSIGMTWTPAFSEHALEPGMVGYLDSQSIGMPRLSHQKTTLSPTQSKASRKTINKQ